jgi:hypothetical protein
MPDLERFLNLGTFDPYLIKRIRQFIPRETNRSIKFLTNLGNGIVKYNVCYVEASKLLMVLDALDILMPQTTYLVWSVTHSHNKCEVVRVRAKLNGKIVTANTEEVQRMPKDSFILETRYKK